MFVFVPYSAAVKQNQDIGSSSDGGGEGKVVQFVAVKSSMAFQPFELSGVDKRRSALHDCQTR